MFDSVKFEFRIWMDGRVFTIYLEAPNYTDAYKAVKAQYPTATQIDCVRQSY